MPKDAPEIERIRNAIRETLTADHLSQNQLAEKAGIASSTVGNILSEKHAHQPSSETLRALAPLIHVAADTLLRWAGHAPARRDSSDDEEIIRILNLPDDVLPVEARYLHLCLRALRGWLGEMGISGEDLLRQRVS